MRVRLPDGTVRTGDAVDLSDADVERDVVAAAVRRDDPVCDPSSLGPTAPDGVPVSLRVACPSPGPAHDVLGVVPPPSFDRGPALAAVGRSRGLSTPADDELARLEARLADRPDPPASPDLASARRRVAEAGADEARLRERAATLRGRLDAHGETGDETAVESVRADLLDVTTDLSEVETERIAAEQRLATLERAARAARDHREERLRLEDARSNRRREARDHFRARLGDEFDAAVRALSARDWAAGAPDPVRAALAAVRMADLRAPVVLDVPGVDAASAAAALDAAVVRL